MKLYFAQLEENREPFIDLFGEVCDDVIIHDLIVDRFRNGLIVKWDYDDAWKAREKKKAEKRLHEIICGKEKRPKKKA